MWCLLRTFPYSLCFVFLVLCGEHVPGPANPLWFIGTGIAIVGFAVTYIFFSLFKLLMTILILALWNGLALMPVVCSLIGPMRLLIRREMRAHYL
mmetsp:Transcript_2896/g.9597  ORF Transcript_2896/g.9597 Transcript_2896/m.9597 type:complete len:95 (-) Transcript_2896:1915-2199(-)